MPRRIVIVGGGGAALRAALGAKTVDLKADVTLISDEKLTFYSRCALPYIIEGEIESVEKTVSPDPPGTKLLRGWKAVDVDPSGKTVTAQNLETGREETFQYDALIIATGSRPFIPPVPGKDLKGVFPLRTDKDLRGLQSYIKPGGKAVVVGARFIGLEVAAALKTKGMDVTVVELLPQIMDGVLDPELAKTFQKYLEERGVKIYLNSPIQEIYGRENVEAVKAGDKKFEADLVVMATGVRPRTELAQKAGAKIGKTRGIVVDERMRTTVEDIYAAGDCTEIKHLITGTPWPTGLGTQAYRQGRVAGINAAGGDAIYPGTLGTCVTKIFDLEVASVGLTRAYAEKFGIKAVAATYKPYIRAEYYSEDKAYIRLVARVPDGMIIGAQIIAPYEAGARANIMAAAMMKGVTVDELTNYDFCYCPPVANVIEGLALAAEGLSRRLLRLRKRGR